MKVALSLATYGKSRQTTRLKSNNDNIIAIVICFASVLCLSF